MEIVCQNVVKLNGRVRCEGRKPDCGGVRAGGWWTAMLFVHGDSSHVVVVCVSTKRRDARSRAQNVQIPPEFSALLLRPHCHKLFISIIYWYTVNTKRLLVLLQLS